MRTLNLFFTFLFLVHLTWSEAPPDKNLLQKEEKKMSKYILEVLEHYKQKDPVGIPGAPVPDPLTIPPLENKLSLGKMTFRNVKLFGLSKFRLQEVKVEITEMKVEASLTIDTLLVYGNYTLSSFFSSAKGPFTVKLTGVHVTANATLQVQQNGQLSAQDIKMDITFKTIAMDFKGLGFFANMFQGVINSVGNFIFDSIKPFILKGVNSNMMKDVNKEVQKLPQRFANSISPFDQTIIDVRNKIRESNLDPYQVADYNNSVGISDIYMTHTWLYGLSSIHREGDIIFEIKNHTVYAQLEVGTQRLQGTSHWKVALVAGLMSTTGTVSFTVEYLKVQIILSQTMDTTNSPRLEDIQLELGNIQIRFDGAGTLDYLIEFGVNVLPNLLRYQIMDALESPIKQRIQKQLDLVKIEELVKKNSDKIDNPGELEFL